MKQRLRITVKWGLLAGAGLMALELLKMAARNLDYPFGPIGDILLILIFIVALVFSGKEYREKELDGLISFAKAFGAGCETVVIAFLLYFGYLFLHFNVIEKGGIDRINNTYQVNYLERLKKEPISEDALNTFVTDAYFVIENQKEETLKGQIQDTDCNNVLNNKLDTLHLFFCLRLKQQYGRDSLHYFYGTFDEYAQMTMMNITEQILNVASEEEQKCLDNFSLIALNSANSLTTLSPLQMEFEKKQPDIPHYDNLLAVVLQSSFMVLLYGLFFNIFTSLYIFKKEKTNCIPSKEDEDAPQE